MLFNYFINDKRTNVTIRGIHIAQFVGGGEV